jgi:monofunctional biosynthetic peptidoglycan transglycosylase
MARFLRRWIVFPLLLLACVPVVVLAGLPSPWILRWVDPPATSFMLYRAREAHRAGEELAIVRDPVSIEDVPSVLERAVLVSEDDRFRLHRGVDWKAIAEEVRWQGDTLFSFRSRGDRLALREALAYYRQHRREIKGRSTLTQQLAKNLYFTPERSLVRKAGEFVVARRLERFLGKDRILELYLNTAELGPGVFGVGAAARRYFDLPAQGVGRFEAASLAATLPDPLGSNPAHRPGRMAWRRDLILARLAGRSVVIPDVPPAVELPPVFPDLDVDVRMDTLLLPDTVGRPGIR